MKPSKDTEFLNLFIGTIIVGLLTLFSYEVMTRSMHIGWLISLFYIFCFYIFIYLIYRFLKFILKSFTSYENMIEKGKNKEGPIYIRDMDSPLSPACVSYLVNNEIEYKKDIVADVLNLIVKKAILIDDDLQLVDGKEADNLTEDELYIYNWIIKKEYRFDKNEFLAKIKNITKPYVYLKRDNLNFFKLFFILYIVGMIVNTILYIIGIHNMVYITGFIICLILFILTIFFAVYGKINNISHNKYFTYTKKGITEIINWERFKKFMEDFGRLNELTLDNVILWDKYLAYAVALNINKHYDKIKIKNIGDNIEINIDNIINKRIEETGEITDD